MNLKIRLVVVVLNDIIMLGGVVAQTVETISPNSVEPKLNLDDQAIARQISETPQTMHSAQEVLSASPNKFEQTINKLSKYKGPPKHEEIYEQGSTDRIERVNPIWGEEYCMYFPTQGRVDGIDSIKSGMQMQMRSCPYYF